MSNTPEHDQTTSQPGIFDAGELTNILGDDHSAIHALTRKYQQLLQEQRTLIQQALKDSDWENAASLAHQLKSSCRVVGAFALADCCESIEYAGKSETGTVTKELVDEFNKLAALVLKAVDVYLQTPIA